MYYSEHLLSPLSTSTAVRVYGINPETQPEAALAAGIYPLTEAPEGYTATHFVREGDTYRAIPHEYSNEERAAVGRIKAMGSAVREFVSDCIPDWDSATAYFTGTFVEHNGYLWQAASASTGVEPAEGNESDWTFIR